MFSIGSWFAASSRRRNRASSGEGGPEVLECRKLLAANGFRDVAGSYGVQGSVGQGTLDIVQNGANLQGTFNTNELDSGTFDANFKKMKSKVAKGTTTLQFTGEPAYIHKFKIKFIFDGAQVDSYWFSYGKGTLVT